MVLIGAVGVTISSKSGRPTAVAETTCSVLSRHFFAFDAHLRRRVGAQQRGGPTAFGRSDTRGLPGFGIALATVDERSRLDARVSPRFCLGAWALLQQ